MSNVITWLHLSDLHYCVPKTGWDAKRVLSSLTTDLQRMEREYSLRPDLIFFTGDLAYGQIGTDDGLRLTDQFKGAGEFIDGVRKSFEREIPVENVFIVPGNHDVNRSSVAEDQILWLDNQRDAAPIDALLNQNSLQWQRYIERLNDYRLFLQQNFSHLVTDPNRLIYSIIRNVNGTRVRVVGLNSAWSSSRDGEKGKLWMGGRWQVETTTQGDRVDLSIALMHHPSNWLVEHEDPQLGRALERHVDFSLHGHEHQEWVVSTSQHVRIAAGACYGGIEQSNGYNLVSVDFESGVGNIWLRRYHQAGGWVPEIVPDRTDNNGVWQVNLPNTAHRHQVPITSYPRYSVPVPIQRERDTTHPFRTYGSDLRPVIDAWVGRQVELDTLQRLTEGVVTVTGIGGQGKSFLVAKLLETWLTSNPDAFWDWRDCREEGERFFTQLVALIEHFTEGQVTGDNLIGADVRAVVRYFFELIGDQKVVIVLDNVDHYVNQRDEKFSLGVGVFVEEALRVARKTLVILTCRPRVSYGSPRYVEVPLSGISLSEALELFGLRGVNASRNNDQIQEIWSNTDGHPLWLNLIATQMARNPQTAPNILEELRKGQVDDRTRSMFRALWRGLNDRQRTVLRCMAEIHYPENRESIQNFSGALAGTRNQFNRAFDGVRSLSLIVERGSSERGSLFDLHPLVRSFIRTEYPNRHERLPYIEQILGFLAQLIVRAEELPQAAPLEELQRWSTKAELELETGKPVEAMQTIEKVSDQLIARGFHEEFFRVAKPVLDSVNWSRIEIQDSGVFHDVVIGLIEALVEHNREAEARAYMRRYEAAAKTTVTRLRFLKVATYVEWMLGNYDEALKYGNEGLNIRNKSDVDITVGADVSHNMALALRDSGRWGDALRMFAPDQSISEVLSQDHRTSGKGAPFYGNIGRCLQFSGELEQAVKCYVKSAAILRNATGSLDILNRGYAALWIGEVLQQLGQLDTAYCFYRLCVHIWSRRAPLRVQEAEQRLSEVASLVTETRRSMSDSEAEEYCNRWLDNSVNVN